MYAYLNLNVLLVHSKSVYKKKVKGATEYTKTNAADNLLFFLLLLFGYDC